MCGVVKAQKNEDRDAEAAIASTAGRLAAGEVLIFLCGCPTKHALPFSASAAFPTAL
jgi:hypothetical protein